MEKEKISQYLGRKVTEQKEFKVEGTFESMYAARKWLKEQGYSTGSSSACKPTAIMKGVYYDYCLPHKWKNFTKEEINSVHGAMTGDFRNGAVFVYLFE